jgi:hypothetical protein
MTIYKAGLCQFLSRTAGGLQLLPYPVTTSKFHSQAALSLYRLCNNYNFFFEDMSGDRAGTFLLLPALGVSCSPQNFP